MDRIHKINFFYCLEGLRLVMSFCMCVCMCLFIFFSVFQNVFSFHQMHQRDVYSMFWLIFFIRKMKLLLVFNVDKMMNEL